MIIRRRRRLKEGPPRFQRHGRIAEQTASPRTYLIVVVGRAPPAVAPVPAKIGGALTATLPFRDVMDLTSRVKGNIVHLANHGVPQTLRTSRSGSSAFVMAYAVANLHVSTLVPEPTFPSEIIAEFLDSYRNPLGLADERWEPSCVVEQASKSKQRDDGGKLMQQQESTDVRYWRFKKRGGITLEEFRDLVYRQMTETQVVTASWVATVARALVMTVLEKDNCTLDLRCGIADFTTYEHFKLTPENTIGSFLQARIFDQIIIVRVVPQRPSTNRTSSTEQKDKDRVENNSRHFPSLKRLPGADTHAKNVAASGVTPLNTSSPAASSAFGLGSGAFASFGSATKTPKTPGTAFDFTKPSSTTASPSVETERQKSSARANTEASPASAREQSFDIKTPLPLKYSWVVWYRPPTSKNSDYEKSIKPLYKASTVQEFWRIYSHLKRPSALPTVSDYHFFKEGIRPVWEDEENKRGGKWIIRFKKGVMDRYWDELLLPIIGDQFLEAGEEVCGMVVSARSGEDVLSVWTKVDGGRNIKIRYVFDVRPLRSMLTRGCSDTIKRVLSLPADTVVLWKSHDDSIAQRSAIDQARQEKAPLDKRRSTHQLESSGDKSKSSS
ncbi:hypothetical protein MRB53_041824 [Persea americana]|nr:hypothetical protein MRB53_041824 [Persea americana]